LTTLKGLPRAYNRDLQNATPHAWETVDAVVEATEVVGGAIATADWPEETLAEAAGEGFSTATGVADLLAAHGLPFRTAHEVVAVASEHGSDLQAIETAAEEVLGEPLESYVDPEDVEAALDPATSAESRDSIGGPAAVAVESYLDDADGRLADDEESVGERRTAIDAAAEALADEVAEYV